MTWWKLLFQFFPGVFALLPLALLALVLIIIVFRIIRMVLDAIPFL